MIINIFRLVTYLDAKTNPFIFWKKCCTTEKSWFHITLLPAHNRHLLTMTLFPQGGRCGEV